jgi:hypothetical protein
MEKNMPDEISLHMPAYSDGDRTNDPNAWFADLFPDAAKKYGPAFLEDRTIDKESFMHITPTHLNDDFFAGLITGDKRLGHSVVWYQPEDLFYFYDVVVDAYCPTTEAKLQLLLSNYLIKCSQSCGKLIDIKNLVTSFREPSSLKKIVKKAKAMLETDSLFFKGPNGRRRWIDGKYIEPTAESPHLLFAKAAVRALPGARMTLAGAYHEYYQFCKSHNYQPVNRTELKTGLCEYIRGEFNISLRHDILDDQGKYQHGWKGLDCRMVDAVLHGVN